MPIDSPNHAAHILRQLRLMLKISKTELGNLLHVTPRTIELWESETRKMPQAKFELLIHKINGIYPEYKELCVIFLKNPVTYMSTELSVVSDWNYVGMKEIGDGSFVISSLSVDPQTKRPYIHKTKFVRFGNEHVFDCIDRWLSKEN